MEWLFPELKKIDPKDRVIALDKAKEMPFDTVELVGLGVALIIVLSLTRYSVAELGLLARVGAALANFVVAIPLLLVFAGPFYVRRTRRGLREYIHKSSLTKPDKT